MYRTHLHCLSVAAITCLLIPAPATSGQPVHSFDAPAAQTASLRPVLDREIHADMEFLADDELHGRGSATRDEHIAALLAASQFKSLGLEPGGPNRSFLQKSPLPDPLPQQIQQI